MPCKTVDLGGGQRAIVCTRGSRPLRCSCGRRTDLVCDWPLEAGGTCDNGVCRECRRLIRGLDICPFHRGSPPMTPEEQAAAGASEAANAARLLGLED
jgi:hypothetical protein